MHECSAKIVRVPRTNVFVRIKKNKHIYLDIPIILSLDNTNNNNNNKPFVSMSESAREIFVFRICLFVLRFYGPVNPTGSRRARSVYLTTLSPLSG